MNKKYLPSALILYLNYFIHGVGCSILGQAVIKEALAASWGVEAMAITAISAALGLGRLIALPFAGPLSDKLGRRISTAIGSGSYAIYLIGLALAFNAGTNGGYHMYVQSLVVLQTPSLTQVFIRQFPRLFTKHRALQLWESNSSSQSHR
jgi:MFS family permease